MGIDRKYKELAKFFKKIKTAYLVDTLPSQLIKKLQEQEVDVVIDVRATVRTPMIYMPKYFEDILSLVGVGYIRYQKLGNPSKLRKEVGDNYLLAKSKYLEYIAENKKSKAQLNELFKRFRFKKNYCLVCNCKTLDVKLCHRFWLKELLINLKRTNLGFSEVIELENFDQKLVPEVPS